MSDLSGKTILITGSSRGIGKAVAQEAQALGAEVICHGSKPSEALEQTARDLQARTVIFNAYDELELRNAIRSLRAELHELDGLVSCAGTLIPVDLDQTSFLDYQEALQIHLATPSILASLLSGPLRQAGGAIVNVASVRSEPMLTSIRSAPYCTMKSAIHNLTCIQAKEYGPLVRANTVSPGWVETEMASAWNEQSRRQASDNLLERVAQANEVAAAILFLLSDSASFITGQNLFVDGGYGLAGK
jgi:3alpha(or 20beta)-hydroxysteroid dehydrogenase